METNGRTYMSEKPKDKVTRFSLITDQGHLIVFDGGKCESDHTQSSGWEIRTSYNSHLSTKEAESFGDLVKDCIAIVNKVL
tara:strand:+ start:1150 stop:1392 length:243 start_codon:yes stop_codon:yes gene_type:complete